MRSKKRIKRDFDKFDKKIENIKETFSFLKNQSRRSQIENNLKYTKNQMDVIFKNLADGVVVFDIKGDIVYFNDSLWKLIYLDSSEDFLKIKNVRNITKYLVKNFSATNGQNIPLSFKDSPTLRVISGEIEPESIFILYNSQKNEKRYLSVKSRPVIKEDGKFDLIVSIVDDITQQKELEERKDEFINVLGHELKTPLTSIKAFAQLLGRKFESTVDVQTHEWLGQINLQIDHFSDLVLQLLDTTQLYNNQLILYKNKFRFNELLKEVILEVSKIDSCHHYIADYQADVDVLADRNRIGQVLLNILSNASRYSPQSDKILIIVSIKNESLVVNIKDFGNGVPLLEQSKIFDRFYQIHSNLYYHDPHLGLGLYISSQIIKNHGGVIGVRSKINKGSVFYFTLPIEKIS